jgi:hypothetical protein
VTQLVGRNEFSNTHYTVNLQGGLFGLESFRVVEERSFLGTSPVQEPHEALAIQAQSDTRANVTKGALAWSYLVAGILLLHI